MPKLEPSSRSRRRRRSHGPKSGRAAQEAGPARPSLLDMKAHGLTRENAARIVQRHATAAPVVSNDVEWRPPPVAKELPNLPKAQGFYGSKDEKQTASETARGLHGVQLTERLTAVLRPHQLEGVQWLCARLWQRQRVFTRGRDGPREDGDVFSFVGRVDGYRRVECKACTKSFRSVVCCPAVRARVQINHAIDRSPPRWREGHNPRRACSAPGRARRHDARGRRADSGRRAAAFPSVFLRWT